MDNPLINSRKDVPVTAMTHPLSEADSHSNSESASVIAASQALSKADSSGKGNSVIAASESLDQAAPHIDSEKENSEIAAIEPLDSPDPHISSEIDNLQRVSRSITPTRSSAP
jgi:hypothetical protein